MLATLPMPQPDTALVAKRTGRPTIRSAKLADSILTAIAGGESLNSITKRDGMPAYWTVLRWLNDDAAFSAKYAEAKQTCAEKYADEIIEIADDDKEDARNSVAVQRSRLKVDARKWVAAKLLPKKYGDAPAQIAVQTNVNVGIVCDEATRARILALRDEGEALP